MTEDFSISLRIRGGSFSSREVSQALGLSPFVVRAADRSKITDIESDKAAAYWSHRFSFNPELNLQEAIALVADSLPKNIALFERLQAGGSKLELFVGLTFERSSGHELDWTVLSKMAEAKVVLSLDLYNVATKVGETPTCEIGVGHD